METEPLSTKLERVCRVCLKICDRDLKSRFVFGELTEEEILDDNLFFVYEILCSVTSIQVNKGDGYPTLVCGDCMSNANIAYRFKRQYEQSDAIIVQCLKEKILENITDEPFDKLSDQEISERIEIAVEDESEEAGSVSDTANFSNNNGVDGIRLESCISTDIFNLSKIEAENVDIETILDNLNSAKNEEKPKIKNISMVDENKIARKCPDCKYIFQTAYAYHNHACNRDDLERKLCPICGKSISKSHYNKHLYMHSGRRDYICHICNKAYNASGSLKFHMAKHTGEKPYLCSLCGKRFIQPTALKYHMRFHNNERRYKCTYCEKSFVMQCHLVAHERVHTGLKPFVCDICNKGFTRKVELKAHAYSHSGQKPYRCQFCDKTFARKTHLTLHEMIHSGKRPHQCNVCGKGFIQKQPLQVHLKIHKQKENGVNDQDVMNEEYQEDEEYTNEIQEFV